MHMQHRDTWNPHLYSGTGTSQRVCHQPASKLECRTNVNELSTSGSIPRCLLTKMPHAVPFHGGGFVCILYKDTVGGWQWPGSRNRLLSEPSSAASRVSASGQRVPRDECGWHGTSSRRAAAVRARPRSACPLRWGRTIFNEIPESPDRGVIAAIGTFETWAMKIRSGLSGDGCQNSNVPRSGT